MESQNLSLCANLNRSLSLYFAITKFLAFTAILTVLAANTVLIDNFILQVGRRLDQVHNNTDVFLYYCVQLLVTGTVTSVVGIWAYARLSRPLLTLYAVSVILEILTLFILGIIWVHRDDKMKVIIELFKNYKTNSDARQAIDFFQEAKSCCGIPNYQFEDLPNLPQSCCDNLINKGFCTKDKVYDKFCPTTLKAMYSHVKEKGLLSSIPMVAGVYISYAVLVTLLACAMIRYLIKVELEEDYYM